MNAETSAEFASDLYSHLDSSGGDYNDVLEQLGKCTQTDEIESIQNSIQTADRTLTNAFELLDEVILEASEFDGVHGRFTRDVKTEVRDVADYLDDAVDAVENALNESQNISEDTISNDFKFGVHTDPESALKYLYGDVKHMRDLAFEMERKYAE